MNSCDNYLESNKTLSQSIQFFLLTSSSAVMDGFSPCQMKMEGTCVSFRTIFR
jgi:hypothetical protein